MSFFYKIKLILFFPTYIIYRVFKNDFIDYEIEYWYKTVFHSNQKITVLSFLKLIITLKEFRNVFYLRLGKTGKLMRFFYPPMTLNYIWMNSENIGRGFILQHGHSCQINAKKIGERVQIWHNVTIGVSESGTSKKPIIGDNVKICAGAIVLGDIIVGDNVTIGAGAVVVKNIPNNSVAVGNPARILC